MANDAVQQNLISTTFVSGEQPDAYKLTAAISHLKTAIERLCLISGDIYSQQSFTGTYGIYGGAHEYNPSILPQVGPNIGRVLGSGAFLNPRHSVAPFSTTAPFSPSYEEATVTFAGGKSRGSDPPTTYGFAHYNKRQFVLPKPPIVVTSNPNTSVMTGSFSFALGATYWQIQAPSASYIDATAKVANRVTNLDDLAASGDYHVSYDGVITLFDELAVGIGAALSEGFVVYYRYTDRWDANYGATPNLIPDFEQTNPLCTVTQITSTTYNIVLPTMNARRSVTDITSWITPKRYVTYDTVVDGSGNNLIDPTDGKQLTLPWQLVNNLSSGDAIPSGLVQLWDETAQEVVKGLTFTYISATQVRSSGVALTTGTTRYRLVVPGADVTASISHLRESFYWHDHSGRLVAPEGIYMGDRMHHEDLLGNIDEGGIVHGNVDEDQVSFKESTLGITRNPHPQYLHRFGYRYHDTIDDGSATEANWHNALMGRLMIGGSNDQLALTANSYGLYFGSVNGPQLYYNATDDLLVAAGKQFGPKTGMKFIGDSLVGAYLDSPRMQSTMHAFGTSVYTLLFHLESQDSTKGDVRIYAAPAQAGVGYSALVITNNASYIAATGYWVRDVADHYASRYDFASVNFTVYTYDATNSDTWADLNWGDLSGDGQTSLQLTANPVVAQDHTTLTMRNGLIAFSGCSDKKSNPTKATNPGSNTLYAKNIPKAWAKITTGGTPAINDGFGVNTIANSDPNALRITLFNAMSSVSYAPLITDMSYSVGTNAYIYKVRIISETAFDLYAWQLNPTGPVISVVNLQAVVLEAAISVFGEQ